MCAVDVAEESLAFQIHHRVHDLRLLDRSLRMWIAADTFSLSSDDMILEKSSDLRIWERSCRILSMS